MIAISTFFLLHISIEFFESWISASKLAHFVYLNFWLWFGRGERNISIPLNFWVVDFSFKACTLLYLNSQVWFGRGEQIVSIPPPPRDVFSKWHHVKQNTGSNLVARLEPPFKKKTVGQTQNAPPKWNLKDRWNQKGGLNYGFSAHVKHEGQFSRRKWARKRWVKLGDPRIRPQGGGVLRPARKVPSSVDRLFLFDPAIRLVIITYPYA